MWADSDHARQTGPALGKAYQFVLWLVPTIEKFPRGQKFLLDGRIQQTAADMIEGLVEVTYTKGRGRILGRVNLLIETLRYLVRLAKDLRHYERAGAAGKNRTCDPTLTKGVLYP